MTNFGLLPMLEQINFGAGAIVLLLGIFLVKIIVALFRAGLRTARLNESLVGIMGSFLEAILWFGLGVIVISVLGFGEAARIISFLGGAFALAIGFGMQDLIKNVLAGFLLAIDEDFRVGYTVRINNIEGVVKHMDYRKVRIKDEKGVIQVLPNKLVDDTPWLLISRNIKEETSGRKRKRKR